jgi:uncharacterized protein (TIRG00374 family)
MSKRVWQLALFAALSVLSIGLIFHFTATQRTWDLFLHLNARYLVVLILLWLFSLVVDSLSTCFYAQGTGERLKFSFALRLTLLRVFFNVITPFSFGGQPIEIYALSRQGIPAGKGSSVVMVKLLTLALFAQLGALLVFVFVRDEVRNVPTLSIAFVVTGLLIGGLVVVTCLVFFYPFILVRIFTHIEKLLRRLKLRSWKNRPDLRRWVVHQASLARRSFRRYFGSHLGLFLAGTLSNGLMYCADVLMLWIILRALGVAIPLAEGFALSALLLFLITFMPTPGTAGLGEVIFVIIFAAAVPKYLLGIAVVLWRFFYQYISAFIGALVSAQLFSDAFIRIPKHEQ